MQSVAPGLDASLLEAVLNQSEFILGLVDESGLLVACNEAVCRNAQRPRAEILGKYIFDLRISFPSKAPSNGLILAARCRSRAANCGNGIRSQQRDHISSAHGSLCAGARGSALSVGNRQAPPLSSQNPCAPTLNVKRAGKGQSIK